MQERDLKTTVTIEMDEKTFSDVIQELERAYLGHVLTKTKGNKSKAADIAGISRDAFRKRVALFTVSATYHVG